ncbi:cation-transporting P-type ATPase [Aestuariivirga sp.]|uniref:cation-transporting P-type ATPase n=1 Tax=Aestuariivirga sp. TaxID=2650926 RepID=UPI003593DC85
MQGNPEVETVASGWHSRSPEEVIAALGTSTAGLSDAEAIERLRAHGPNKLPEPRRRGPLLRFLAQFHNVLIYVLLGSAAITAALDHLVDTLVILAVVFANAAIGFIQEGKAENAMEAIRGMLAPQAAVLRGGKRRAIDGKDLVPGDIVLLEAGDKVPADLRLIQARGLKIEESVLTGESMPAEKHVRSVAAGAALGDRSSMTFSGTLVAAGHAHGVVVATASATEIGRISGMLSRVETLTTPLVRQMDGFARWLTLLILLISGLLLVFGFFVEHFDFADVFMAVVGLAVAAIPEGLPAVLTITLAIGVRAMARRNVIVRRLPAIETLGAVSVICTDKTGTLTRNEMFAATVATHGGTYAVTGEGYAPLGGCTLNGRAVSSGDQAALMELGRLAALCNDAALRWQEDQWLVEGDPMEGALLALSGKLAGKHNDVVAASPRIDAIPFDSAHRFMATLHHDGGKHWIVAVKGAPERILAMCSSERTKGGRAVPLHESHWHEVANAIAAKGQRVLALATRHGGPAHGELSFADVEGHLTLVGLVGLIDPPRPEAIEAVAECHRAGIRVKMITGDHAGTAAAIGETIGLKRPDKVLTGADIDGMDDALLAAEVLETDVFARTSPEHKLRLVMALQGHGLTVAMTGDGVNDAPALKRADAGIAMGKKGSEAAKEAAEIVLADDNFASIAAAVREGRTVYDNIKKVISWTLPTSAGEASTILVALLLGLTLPVTPIQILWVNLITAITLGLALAFEPTEENTMRRPPRLRHASLLTGGLVWHILLVSVLFLAGVFGIFEYAMDRGYAVETARTMAVNTLVVMEIFHLFFIRNIYGTSLTWKAVTATPVVWATVLAITCAQFAITYLPPLQRVFGTTALSLLDGVLIVGIGVALFAFIEVEKQIRLVFAARRDGW